MHKLAVLFLSFLVFQAAVACPVNCEACSEPTQCSSCTAGYQLLMDNSCKQMNYLQGCHRYTLTGRCGKCTSGFNLFGGFCYQLIANCQQYGPGNTCAQCKSNYTPRGDVCVQSNYSSCDLPGTVLHQGMCISVPLTNCQKILDGRCMNCSLGYKLINGLCFKLGQAKPAACELPGTDGSCNKCASIYFKQSGACLAVILNNCVQNVGLYCTVCQQNYVNNNGACFRPPRPEDPNCNVVDIVSLQCTGCNFQYRLNSTGWCIRQDFYCQTSDSNGQCTSCPGQLLLKAGSCVYADQNCVLADYENMVCLRCKPGFALTEDHTGCSLLNACLQYDESQTRCTRCIDTHQLINGSCSALGFSCLRLDTLTKACVACQKGTSLMNGFCVYSVSNCLIYDILTGGCTECESGYYIRNSSCNQYPDGCIRVDRKKMTCSGCGNGLILANGSCVAETPDCLYYTSLGCQFCRLGTYLRQGKCNPFPKRCGIVDAEGRCLLCIAPSVVWLGRCVYFQVFCLDYAENGNCTVVPRDFSISSAVIVVSRFAEQWDTFGNIIQCRSGFTLINNNCVTQVDDCLGYDQMGACMRCSNGFALKQGSCLSDTEFCLTKQADKCLLCTPDFAVVNGSCYGRKNFGLTFDVVGYPLTYQVGYLFTTEYNVSLALAYNCIKQNFSSGQCLQCAKYYTLQAHSCIARDSNCLSYNLRGICQICSRGFKYIFGVCRSTQFCSAMASNGSCSSCYQGFTLTSGMCLRQAVKSCGAYDSNSICLSCYPGYSLTPINTCVQKPKGCLSLSNQTEACERCEEGHKLVNGLCVKLTEHCQTYSSSGCSACSIGFILVGEQCLQLPLLCKSLDPTTLKCAECTPGFVLVNNKEFCANNVPRCSNYNFDGSCRICSRGSYLSNNRCLNTTDRCVRYNENSTCIECTPPYKLVGAECRMVVSNCNEYTNGACSRCESGYYYSREQCIANPVNCDEFNNQTMVCMQCSLGFTVKGGVCTTNNVNMDGCAQQLSPVECKECLPGYSLGRNGLCLALVCLRFDLGMRCTECPPRFDLVNGLCKSRNCSQHNSTTFECKSCISGYQLVRNSTKVVFCRAKNCLRFSIAEECANCAVGYTLNTRQTCSIANCVTEVNLVCFACKEGYVLRDKFCQANNCNKFSSDGLCTGCDPKYILVGGLCVKDPKCNAFDTNGTCQRCQSGYTLNNIGQCRLSNCNQVAQDKCVACFVGFTLTSQGLCLSSVCLVYDSHNNCTQCPSGYSLIDGACWLTGCATLSPDGACAQCKPRFSLYNGVCRPSNCTSLSPSNATECRECNSYYELVNGVCMARNCGTYDSQKDCAVCEPGFSLLGGFCYFQNCRRFSSVACLQCVPGYYFDERPLCLSTRCRNYNTSTGRCISCFAGLRLRGDLCVNTYCNLTAADGTCRSCLIGYALDNSSYCWLPDPCSIYNANRNCISCIAGFQLDPSGSSCQLSHCLYLADSSCIQCMAGFELQNGICQASFCDRFDSLRDCAKCRPGYSLQVDGSCQATNCQDSYDAKCIKCLAGYSLLDGLCQINTCGQYHPNGSCILCIRGYALRQGKCLSEFCLTFNNDACTQCRGGYMIDNGLCIRIVELTQTFGCASYNYISGRCSLCNPGFRLNKYACQPRYCLQSDYYQCQQCLSGYKPVQGGSKCLADNCTVYDNVTLQCTGCQPGYVAIGGQCIYQEPVSCPPGQYSLNRVCTPISIALCQRMDNTGMACTKCAFLSTLISGRCFNLNNCNSYDKNGCQVCNAGYYLSNSFCVVSKVSFCNVSDSTGKCISCLTNYLLKNDVCTNFTRNCLQYKQDGCIVCLNGFIAQEGLCVQLGPHCASLTSEGVCERCTFGYQLSAQNSCIQTIERCKQYNSTGCESCLQGYTLLSSGYCTATIQGCVDYSSEGDCEACKSSYVVQDDPETSKRICFRLVQNCVQYSSIGCVSCKSGLRLVGGACSQILSNCIEYDKDSRCLLCTLGFYLSANLCIPLPRNCLSVNSRYICTVCANGYVLTGGSCVVANSLCLEYRRTDGRCIRCSSNARLDSNSNCVLLPGNCLKAVQSGGCILCQEGFQLFDDICFKLVLGCQQYTFRGCSSCLTGYSNTSSGQCEPDQGVCQMFDSSISQCLRCSSAYTLVAGVCYRTMDGCMDYAISGKCTQCQPQGYTLTTYGCIRQQPNCLTYDSSGRCKQCQPSFTLLMGHCVNVPQGCVAANTTGCTKCRNGLLLINNRCVPNSLTRSNVTSSTTINTTTTVQTISNSVSSLFLTPNCKLYAQSVCTACNTGFRLVNGSCLLPEFCLVLDLFGNCANCTAGYISVRGVCYLSVQYCSAYRDQRCVNCIDNYYLSKGLCNQLPQNCLKVDEEARCISCSPSSVMMNGVCSTPIPNCFLYDSQSRCQSCRFLYYLSKEGQCIAYPSNCVSVDQLGYCLSCCQGAYLQSGYCVTYSTPDSSCQSYDPSSTRCVQCNEGFSYCISCNRCVQLDPNCYSFSIYDFTLCTACNVGFYLISNECVSSAPGVLELSNGTLKCRPSYLLSGTHCYKNPAYLTSLSNRKGAQLVYSSTQTNLLKETPEVGSDVYWRPLVPNKSQYVGYRTQTTTLIEAIRIQGNGVDEWISAFTIEYSNSNSQGNTFRCWNNCTQLTGNSDPYDVVTISFDFPIVATEVRLYPQSWVKSPSCRLAFLID